MNAGSQGWDWRGRRRVGDLVGLCEWSCFSEGGRTVGCGPWRGPVLLEHQSARRRPSCWRKPAPLHLVWEWLPGTTPPPPPQAQTGSLSASCLTEDSNDMCVGGPEAGDPLIDQVPLSPEASYPLLGELHQCTCTKLVTLCRAGTSVRRVTHSLILRGTKRLSNQEEWCFNTIFDKQN